MPEELETVVRRFGERPREISLRVYLSNIDFDTILSERFPDREVSLTFVASEGSSGY
jgi:hypothetical protein